MIDIHSRHLRVANEMSIYIKQMELTNKHMRKNHPELDKHFDVEKRKLDKLKKKAFEALFELQCYALGQSTEKIILGD